MNLTNLDDVTRRHMRAEIELDIDGDGLYQSPRLSPRGVDDYPALLLEAAKHGTPDSFAEVLTHGGRLKTHETATRKDGTTYSKKVPRNAHETLAEGEFNRFYIRGVCLRALEAGEQYVRIYRAKQVANPRAESEAKIGTLIDANALLRDLRASPGVEPALGLPPGPNSGLSVQLVGV